MDKPFIYGLVGCCLGALIYLIWREQLGQHGYVLPLFLFNVGYLIAKLDTNNLKGGEGKKTGKKISHRNSTIRRKNSATK